MEQNSFLSGENFLRKAHFVLLTVCIIFGGGNNRVEAQTIIKNDSIKPYISFLENNSFLSSKEYILSKFETHDIVILSERFHHDMSQYDVIMDVVKDERFKGHIYTEIGHVNLYEKFNNFLLNSTLSEEEKERELLNIYRDLSPSFIWGPYNYYHMLSEVWELNKNRKLEDKVLIFPTDIPFDYNEIQTYRERNIHYLSIFNGGFRDQIMGKNFIECNYSAFVFKQRICSQVSAESTMSPVSIFSRIVFVDSALLNRTIALFSPSISEGKNHTPFVSAPSSVFASES